MQSPEGEVVWMTRGTGNAKHLQLVSSVAEIQGKLLRETQSESTRACSGKEAIACVQRMQKYNQAICVQLLG